MRFSLLVNGLFCVKIGYKLYLILKPNGRNDFVTTLQVTPTNAALGAEITGIKLNEALDAATVALLKEAFYRYGVLRFRGQELTKAAQVHFSSYFGEPVPHPTNQRDRDPAQPEITLIANIQENGKTVGALGNAELTFHADLVFLHTPGSVSLLYCVETPTQGGDTYWSNGYAAYDALDDATKARIEGVGVVYVHANPAYNPPVAPIHPLVCTHPETARKMLFLSPNAAQSVTGMAEAEGRALLDQLYAHATQERFVWRHQWQPGDLIMWDNRCTMHRRDGFPQDQRRLMWRTQLLGPCTI